MNENFYDYDPTSFICPTFKRGKNFKIGHFCVIGKNVIVGDNVRFDHSIVIDDDVQIGDDSYIGSWVHIRPGVRIGNDSEVRDLSFVGPGAEICDHVRICNQCFIVKHCRVGNWCYIAPGLQMANTKTMSWGRDFDNKGTIHERFFGTPMIEDGVRIGNAVTILPGVTLARDCYIGGGAVMVKSTESFGIYAGVPGKKIGEVPEAERFKR